MTAPDTPTQDDLLVLLPRLRRYARVLSSDVRRADELVLETLRGASGTQLPPAPWQQLRHRLFAVMHRLHREWLEGEPRRPPRLPGATRDGADPRGLPPPAALLDRGDNEAMLARFSRLPAEQREVLALVVLEGLPYTEIADVLDVPVGTVLSRLHSAREGDARDKRGVGGIATTRQLGRGRRDNRPAWRKYAAVLPERLWCVSL